MRVRQAGIASALGLAEFGDGSGLLRLEGFEEVQISWTTEQGRALCQSSVPLPSTGPWGVFGTVLEADGGPAAAVVLGCGARAETEEDGSFYMTRGQGTPCTLSITGELSAEIRVLPAAASDTDLGTIHLPTQMRGFGLMLLTPVIGWNEGNAQDSYQVNATVLRSPAARSGLREGDRITHVDGQPVAGRHPAELLQNTAEVTLKLSTGQEHTLLQEELVQMQTRAGMAQEEAEQSARDRSGGTLY